MSGLWRSIHERLAAFGAVRSTSRAGSQVLLREGSEATSNGISHAKDWIKQRRQGEKPLDLPERGNSSRPLRRRSK